MEWLTRRYTGDGATLAEIAAEIGANQGSVSRALARHGIPTRGGRPGGFPQLRDAAWLADRYTGDGAAGPEIAAEVGCTPGAVYRALKAAGITTRRGRPGGFPQLRDAAWLADRYTGDGATLAEIAAEVGCGVLTVSKALKAAGITTRRGRDLPGKFPQLRDVEWLTRRYVGDGATGPEIAAEVGCATSAVHRALKAAGITARPLPGGLCQFPQLRDLGWVARRYVDEGATGTEIAREVGCSPGAVYRALRRAGIATRGSSLQRAGTKRGGHLSEQEIERGRLVS